MIQIKCDKCSYEFAITKNKCPKCGDPVKVLSKFYCGDCENELDVEKGICSHCNKRPKEIIVVSKDGNRVRTEFETVDQSEIEYGLKKENVEEIEESNNVSNINQAYKVFSIVALIYIIVVRSLELILNGNIISNILQNQFLSSRLILVCIVTTVLPISFLIISLKTTNNKTKFILGIITSIILIFSTSLLGNLIFILYLIDSIRYLIIKNKE